MFYFQKAVFVRQTPMGVLANNPVGRLGGYKGRGIIIDLNVLNGTVAMFDSFPENLPGH